MALKNTERHSRVCETSKMCCCVPQMASSAQLFITALFFFLSTFFLAWKFGAQSKEKKTQVCAAADAVRWSGRSSLISILFLPFGFKLLNSLEILGCALLS